MNIYSRSRALSQALGLAFIMGSILGPLSATTASQATESAGNLPALDLPKELRSVVPLPMADSQLPSVEAKEYFKVADEALQLECPTFDAAGDLLFCEVFGGRLFRLTPQKELTSFLPDAELRPAGLAVHKDGRIYMAELGDFQSRGSVVSLAPDGTDMRRIVSRDAGFLPDDLVFDRNGGFYFTDFKGGSSVPTGGVYYVGPDGGKPVLVVPNLKIANGIGLSPDGKTLWVTELAGGNLHRIALADPTTVAPFGSSIVYSFTGGGPDSLRIDAEGNVYVAVYGQGKVMAFNPLGFPVGQYLLPGRDEGHFLRSTSMVIRPGTDEMLIFSNDWDKGQGSRIFAVKALAKAAPDPAHAK
ncbi:SMP-30/gluconolactonase/LRE family protein [Phyllobacterium sp. 21LDTY02-6]|uniref:SMP-30/gluconolactonase/LRE family protein n=1 Tax=Phyllobacterium sp. 21LDTY02-6 TaxID=2944903 RepID=UPI0020224AFC|nr:SMP-30/gluconolactonase/LRE family protein [Phyllobacterium sp. 21LDTY02-6]MCO4318108.1 SMP-30/gluconolactonase/LRE family protein [Phyllobacterium sp. 21LDTY02-6]